MAALVRRAWLACERFAEGPYAALAVVGAALAVYALVSVALPLAAGRDLARYLLVYAQLFDPHVVYPHAVLTRTPVAPLAVGALADAGPLVAEAGAALLYALSVLAWCAVARRFGPAAAIVTAVALLLYPGYVLLFHQLSSDALFATAFALLAVALARALEHPSAGRAAVLGASVALAVLVRPVGQVLLLLVLVPLVVGGPAWRERVRRTAAFALVAGLPLLGWAVHNQVRLDDLTVARGGGASLPLFRAFVQDRIVEPENGPASRELARVVARELLPREPYRSYGVDLETFFSAGSSRMHDDLIVLADRTWGWDDDYAHLARVGREAVLAHPGAYARGVARDLLRLVVWPIYPPLEAKREAVAGVPVSQGLPPPTEGQPIPSAREAPYISTPDGRIREVWTSATEHHIVFSDPADTARAAALDRRVDELLAGLPDRGPRVGLVRVLEDASRWYPRPVVWLVVGLVALAWRRPRGASIPLALAAAALLVLLATALAVYAVAEYSVPVAPAFVLLATLGVLGRYRPLRGAAPARLGP